MNSPTSIPPAIAPKSTAVSTSTFMNGPISIVLANRVVATFDASVNTEVCAIGATNILGAATFRGRLIRNAHFARDVDVLERSKVVPELAGTNVGSIVWDWCRDVVGCWPGNRG